MSFTSGVKKVNEEQVMNSMTMKNMKCFIAKGVTFLIKLVGRAINRSKEMHLLELIRFSIALFWYKVPKCSANETKNGFKETYVYRLTNVQLYDEKN